MSDDNTPELIEAICPGARVVRCGKYWSVTLPCGKHTGAREDGVSLVRDLLAIRDAQAAAKAAEMAAREAAPVDPLTEKLARMEAAKAALDERNEPEATDVPEMAEPAPEATTEPPVGIADLFDLSLTPRQNQDVLQKKYAYHMSQHYRLRDYGDQHSKSEAQWHLEKAQRIESGIVWNRARLAEVL